MRTIPLLLAAVLLSPAAAQAKTWSVACAADGCVAIDSDGGIAYIDAEKQVVSGVDKLTDSPKSPFSISCAAKNVGEGCVIVDGAGRLWFGSTKPGKPYKASDNKLP